MSPELHQAESTGLHFADFARAHILMHGFVLVTFRSTQSCQLGESPLRGPTQHLLPDVALLRAGHPFVFGTCVLARALGCHAYTVSQELAFCRAVDGQFFS